MTKRDVINVAVKLLGVVSIVYGILAAGMMIVSSSLMRMNPGRGTDSVWWMGSVGQVALCMFLGFALMGFADGISKRLAADDSAIPSEVASARECSIFAVAIRVVGVVVLAGALPSLVGHLAEAARIASEQTVPFGEALGYSHHGPWVLADIISILLGVYLILGAKGLFEFVCQALPSSCRETKDQANGGEQ